MHPKPIDWERKNETAVSRRTLFNGFWIIIKRIINSPTIVCICVRTELLFFTIHTVVYSVSRKIFYIWYNNGTMKKSECFERIRSSDYKILHSTASTAGLVSESGQSKHSQM